ncbi:unnamed protein product, partial [marine sediment metagenome]
IIDVESNGLWGQPFAVGAVRMTSGGRVIRTFSARCNIDEVPDDWIVNNEIEGMLEKIPKVEDVNALMGDFIGWYSNEGERNTFVDTGFPVDCRFLDLMRRDTTWQSFSPYPLYDVSTIIVAAGDPPNVDRLEYAEELIGEKQGIAHDPVWDAELSGLCAIRALRKLQTLHGER